MSTRSAKISITNVILQCTQIDESIVDQWVELLLAMDPPKDMTVKMSPIPDYGDQMTREEFFEFVESGSFIDYDGPGYLATETEMSDRMVLPSNYSNVEFPQFTHVVWFNR